ncbi:DUF6095 family protein [Flavobacterium sp.]|uniref:DUF6095 family protein n=1 Tax=Flavobacterium sp. TaxID=239 RepID=UPI0038FC4334
MPTNQKLLAKGIKQLAWALPLLFIGPSVIYNAFMNKNNSWHYLVLGIGVSVCLLAVYFLFYGLKTLMHSIFND